MFCDEIRRAVEAAPRSRLPDVAAVMWRAYGAGQIGEVEAEALSTLIEARKALPATPAASRRPAGSRPRTDASMERRRRWAAAGRLPPQIAAQFTLAESAVLAVITVETVKRGDCRLHNEAIAALAGVSRSSVKAALRRARVLGLLTVTERRASAWRNLSNVVRIVNREWLAWMRLARAGMAQGGRGQIADRHEYSGSNPARKTAGGRVAEAADTAGSRAGQRLARFAQDGGAGEGHAMTA